MLFVIDTFYFKYVFQNQYNSLIDLVTERLVLDF